MKNLITLLTLAMFFIPNMASAEDYNDEIIEEAKSDYERTNLVYSITEVAEKLGVSAAELGNELEAWKPVEEYSAPRTDLFCLVQSDGTDNTTPSASWGGYYLNKNGDLDNWGSNGYWFVHPDWDLAADELYLCVGQNPTKPLLPGETVRCTIAMTLYGTRVTFGISLTIKQAEGIDKTPTTTLSDLEIVGRTTYAITQVPNTDWYNEPNQVAVPGMAEALGIDPDYFANKMRYIIYAKKFDDETENWSNQLVNDLTATPTPGFWFGTGVQFEGDEQESDELQHANYGSTDKFWVASLTYLPGDTIYCTIGQYAYQPWRLGETHNAEIYFIYGNKAWVINFVVTVDVNTDDVIENYTSVGSKAFEFNRNPRDGWDTIEPLEINTEEIYQLLGAESIFDIRVAATDEYGGLTSAYTADTTGFWFLPDGKVTSYNYGTTSFYINYVADSLRFELGNMPDAFNGGEECNATIYFIKDDKYYEFTFKVTMDKPQFTIETCEVEEVDLVVRFVPTVSGGPWEVGQTDMSEYEEILGSSKGILYGLDSNGDLTNAYSVSEADGGRLGGGFWMSPEDENHYAYAAGYSGEGAFAMWYYNSLIHWYMVPGFRQPGEYSTATFYVFNLWDGKALKLNTTIKFISQDAEIKTIGEEDIVLKGRDPETDDFYETDIDLTACCAKFRCEEEDLIVNGIWMVRDAEGYPTSSNYDNMYGFCFDADGAAVESMDEAAFTVGYSDEGTLRAYIIDDANLDKVYQTVLYVFYNDKYYAFNITVGSEELTAIKSLDADSVKAGRIYDLSGREVTSPSKGLYIKEGKKFLLK